MLDANRFSEDGSTYLSNVPRTYVTNSASLGWNDLFSSRKIQNAAYWKIANVELGYNFPDKWFDKYVSDVRFYISAQNLHTFTGYHGYNVDYAGGTFHSGIQFLFLSYCTYFHVWCSFYILIFTFLVPKLKTDLMKLNKYSLALILGFGMLTSCNDRLELLNPNQQTSSTFGFNPDDLEECVIAAYNHIRMEGSYARVGYTIDVCRGDEAWNSSQVWYLPFDDLNAEVTSDVTWWPWREWYYTINVCNFTISRCGEDNSQLTEK